ncbi:glycoside hydrolase family 30 protein [Chitinophaga sp.]|uniref:glycoside hydrolase family 30 protein n=1 Tax=Chitinophaga sp. TaxID=1869181 RepID=UPI002C39C743|nr:glycoside hydrolase family 30 beta sandwich domain-containing protein [Chitinophaga sp.]HWV67359.1 glycoside hydrolase family 30 beta sandwich domain-containing protein [Chitinophaga sp.]
MQKIFNYIIFAGALAVSACSGSKGITQPVTPADTNRTGGATVNYWITSGDQQSLLKQADIQPVFATANANGYTTIEVDTATTFQEVEGFGYTLTGGSAQLINAMSTTAKQQLLQELFGNTTGSIGISYLRISIGASDLNTMPFTYNDVPAGQTDLPLAHFSLQPDMASGTGLIPLLKEILLINPQLKILATPWSAPVWMKDNGSFKGGILQTQYYEAYAQYLVTYVQQMKAAGIPIDAITPQNEPLNPDNNPSLKMVAEAQRDFIKNNLGPAFTTAGLTTKIIVYDHNCDHPDYPLTILADAAAAKFVHGSAFHLYAGDISALSTVHTAAPDKALYFTEQWTSATGSFDSDLRWHIKNVIIGSMRNYSRTALEWNLANDPGYGPHTPGGCTECKGALTISGNNVTRNVAWYIIAHASRFVPAGAVRIGSNNGGNLYSVAFKRPDGKKVLIVLNDNNAAASFNLKYQGKQVIPLLPAGSVATFVW